MPLPDHIRGELDSRVADANVTGGRNAGMLVAGVFLREFVPDGLAWAHIDIAGPSFHTGRPYGYTTKGGTGVPVRWRLADIAERLINPGSLAVGSSGLGLSRVDAHGRAAPLPRVVVAHPLQVADDLCVVDRHPQRPGELLGGRGAADPTPESRSPSFATSTIVVSVTVVCGSTKASTPSRAAAHARRCVSSSALERRSTFPAGSGRALVTTAPSALSLPPATPDPKDRRRSGAGRRSTRWVNWPSVHGTWFLPSSPDVCFREVTG